MMRPARILISVIAAVLVAALGQACSRKSSNRDKSSAQSKGPAPARERGAPTIKNFAANPTDNKGQRILIRGQSAALLTKDSYSITNMVIQTERNGVPDMIIEAP